MRCAPVSRCENWTRRAPTQVPACSVVGAGRLGTVLAAALSDAPALRRGEPIPATAEVVLLCVPDGKIAEVAATRAGGPAARPLLRRDRAWTSSARREGFSLHPLMSVPTGSEPACCAAPARRSTARPSARWTSRATLAGALGHARHPRRAPRIASPTTPRARSRPTSSSRWRPAPSAWRPPPGITRAQLAPLVLATAEQWARARARGGADGRDRARRRGHGRAPSRRDRRAHPGAPAGLDRARRGHTGRGG